MSTTIYGRRGYEQSKSLGHEVKEAYIDTHTG